MMYQKDENGSQRLPGYIEAHLIAMNAYGEENAVKLPVLTQNIGASSKRKVQDDAQKEKEDGAFILSSDKGIFLPDNNNPVKAHREITKFMQRQHRMALSLLRINGRFKQRLQIPYQTVLIGDEEVEV